ncbi:MAG: hypothetical protein SV201_14075 [Pseudomonadota bacterium]|nr:hypothetical protein [Pseudomonadota bacterium]
MQIIELGTLTRANFISAGQDIDNSVSPADFTGYIEAVFDRGCGAYINEPFPMIPKQLINVKAGEILPFSASLQCGDMPLGDRTFTVTLYDADASTIIEQVVVNFTLIE